jgi:molybdopterin synthase catalytic subunit
MTNWVALLSDPLPSADALAFVADPSAGGIAVFAGITRAQTDSAGRTLKALDYEAYGRMAERQLADLADESRRRWPIVRLVILHRIGRVRVAEPSVVIAVSTPHRPQAFEACRWLIDSLKSQVAIWKKEIWSDGSTSWVGSL